MMGNETDEITKKLFDSLLQNYKKRFKKTNEKKRFYS